MDIQVTSHECMFDKKKQWFAAASLPIKFASSCQAKRITNVGIGKTQDEAESIAVMRLNKRRADQLDSNYDAPRVYIALRCS